MPEMTLSREEALDSYLTANKLAIEATVWSRIYRRQAIEGLTFREGSKWEDNVYSLEAFYQSTGDFHALPIAGYNYRIQRPGAITATEIPDLRDLFADIEESIDRHAGDTTYMEYANTLAVRSLWYHFRLLCRASDLYKEEVTDYLQIANKLRCRPFRNLFRSRSKRIKFRLFLIAPRAFVMGRRAFNKLKNKS